MQTFLVIIGAIAIFIFFIRSVLKLIEGAKENEMKGAKTTVEKHETSPRQETQYDNSPRPEIKYVSQTSYGSQTYTKSMTGTSTSTISRTYGTMGDFGKVVTSIAEIAQLSAGDTIRFKSTVSSNNIPQLHQFFTYICDEFHGLTEENQPIWETISYCTLPLLLELHDGDIKVINNDYGLTLKVKETVINNIVQGRPMFVPTESVFVWDEAKATGTKQYCGLVAGDEVVVTGAIVLAGSSYAVEAQHIKMSR